MGDLDPASSSVIELHLPTGLLAGEQYAQTAPDHIRLFNFSDLDKHVFFSGPQRERVMLDAHSVPLFHSKYTPARLIQGPRHDRVDVYRGEYDIGGSLVFTVIEKPYLKGLNVFLAGSSLDGHPDYELKVANFALLSDKIFQQDLLVAKFKGAGHLHPHYKITYSSSMDPAMVVMLVAVYDDLRPKM